MKDLSLSVNNLRSKYREIFVKSASEIEKRINSIKPDGANDIFDKYEVFSAGYKWQQDVIKLFDEEISKEIYRKWTEILAYRESFHCVKCGNCCKLACSEFSYDELLEKTKNSDNFAKQFTSVFIPYESKDDAKAIYPEYIELLDKNKDGEVYFYHCPKIDENNCCSDYENRPQICKDFPDNPLTFLPKSCGFAAWKEEVEPVALMLHAMLEIVEYYKNKISNI